MRTLPFILGSTFSAVLGCTFAAASNLIAGRQLICIGVTSGVIYGLIFAVIVPIAIGITGLLLGKSSKSFFLGSGIAYGALIYIGYVTFDSHASFSLVGLGLISCFGLISGIGALITERIARLQKWT